MRYAIPQSWLKGFLQQIFYIFETSARNGGEGSWAVGVRQLLLTWCDSATWKFCGSTWNVRRASRCKRRSTLKYPFHKRFTPVQYCFNHYVSSVKINQFLHSQVSWIFLSTFSLKRARCPNFYSTRRRSAVFSMLESRAIEVYIRHGYTAWRDVMWHFLSLIITSLSIANYNCMCHEPSAIFSWLAIL